MGLFSSRFAKLESFVETEAGKRTPAQLTEAQLVYAANDAYAAVRVYNALGLS